MIILPQSGHGETLESAFGIELRRQRELKKLSQEELAEICGIHRTYVSQLERGLKSPTLRLLWQICDALVLNPTAIISDIEKAS